MVTGGLQMSQFKQKSPDVSQNKTFMISFKKINGRDKPSGCRLKRTSVSYNPD